ncbi:M23 family metallopeptidase [Dactylosporangium aurantiacum]|uniref:M23 family metallopeptidase n=1 Tax=Dactylosporangium aurantiacum TaxID=35754 RepID=A0A9Q9IKI2_9ACTN|nr:peptidoglycan DD-metalloendopeptidase family protein [Dactylosporangium aurantiacum]MDG6109859.1 peptidoglycan DD-metalloendopeptidase family protein [Dactylosporangium aurantiacum]UWZ57842.1 M23 family metallopeptidase [Dactylosporangium aurantiacum]
MRRRLTVLAMVAAATVALAALGPAAVAAPASVPGTVSSGKVKLTVRAAPTAASAPVTALRTGAKLTIACWVRGPRTKGRVRTTDRWDRLTSGAYVSDAYVSRRTTPPACPAPAPAPATPTPSSTVPPVIVPPTGAVPVSVWVAPVPGKGSSGFRTVSRPAHDGIDIMAARETPIRATAAGTVVTVVCNTSGPSCDVDGSPAVKGCGWYVEIHHAGDIVTRYCHMVRRPDVTVGQQVSAGQTIGAVGTSGNSSGPHLHFEVHYGRPATRLNAVDPVPFMKAAGAPVA